MTPKQASQTSLCFIVLIKVLYVFAVKELEAVFVAGSLQEEACTLSACEESSGSLAQQRRLLVQRHQKRRDAVLEVG